MVWRRCAFSSAVLGLVAVSFAWTAGAGATPITRTFDFRAFDMENFGFNTQVFPPTDPVVGRARIVFDPSGPAIVDDMAGLLDFSSNIFVESPLAFSYEPALDILSLGGIGGGVDDSTLYDFRYRIGAASTVDPFFVDFWRTARPQSYSAGAGSVSLVRVPEPSSLALLLAGLSLMMLFLCATTARSCGRAGAAARG